jgi:protein phosphatase PTC2/3
MKADEKLYDLVKERKIEDSGSTALAALVHGTQLFVANAGDSRAVLSRRGRPVELSTDHKAVAAAEAVRIEAEGKCFMSRWST